MLRSDLFLIISIKSPTLLLLKLNAESSLFSTLMSKNARTDLLLETEMKIWRAGKLRPMFQKVIVTSPKSQYQDMLVLNENVAST